MHRLQSFLSRRIRVIVKISALYALQERVKARTIVQRKLRRAELSPSFFSELSIHLSLFLGYPSMLDGLESVADASRQRRRSSLRTQGSTARKHGKRILERIYGRQTPRLLRHLDDLYTGLGHRITQDTYGLIMRRGGLTLPERELANVVVLYTHGFDRQLYSHLRGALRLGVSKRTLKSVVLLTAESVGKASKRTLGTIDKLSAE